MTKALLVASTGGHLAQLVRIAQTLDVDDDSVWVTFRTPQSESLLAGRRVVYVPYVRPRDWRGAFRAGRAVSAILRRESFDLVVSTGAAPAVPAMLVAAVQGVRRMYIESVSRVNGPSLSGRIIAASRLAPTYTQHAGWASDRWRLRDSVFAAYAVTRRDDVPERPSLFVTLGTIEGFRFDAMIDAVLATGMADERTVWQLGFTGDRPDLPGRVYQQVSAAEFDQYATEADVVISHSGVGSLLGLLELGIAPVLVVRRKARGEHVDDHQAQIAALASANGIALGVEAEDLTSETIWEAAARRIDLQGSRADKQQA